MGNVSSISRRLTYPQVRFILEMTLQPVTLGCVQATAERLSRASGGRPALVVKEEYGRGRPMYALNELGYEVKNHLVAQLLERLKYV